MGFLLVFTVLRTAGNLDFVKLPLMRAGDGMKVDNDRLGQLRGV